MKGTNNVVAQWNEIETSVKTVATYVLGFKERRTKKKLDSLIITFLIT